MPSEHPPPNTRHPGIGRCTQANISHKSTYSQRQLGYWRRQIDGLFKGRLARLVTLACAGGTIVQRRDASAMDANQKKALFRAAKLHRGHRRPESHDTMMKRGNSSNIMCEHLYYCSATRHASTPAATTKGRNFHQAPDEASQPKRSELHRE